jgi:ABC-type nitrate/sulfonate/bicarbonate transport system ATPase subunit
VGLRREPEPARSGDVYSGVLALRSLTAACSSTMITILFVTHSIKEAMMP